MSEQYLITLDEWKPKRFSLPITNTTLVKYGKLGYIVPRPQKIRGRWLIDRRAVFVGPGETGIAPENIVITPLNEGNDEAATDTTSESDGEEKTDEQQTDTYREQETSGEDIVTEGIYD